jgi:hypothetical protein
MPADRRSNRRVNRRFDDLAVICTRLVHVHQHLHLHIVDGMVSEVQTGPSARSASGSEVSLMHRGHQAAPGRTEHDRGTGMDRDGLSRQPGQLRPPALLPSAVAGPPGVAVRALGTAPESPRAAREFTREALRRWDMCAVFPDTAVVISELVTNALCHGAGIGVGAPARGQVELSLWHRASHLVCAVTDPSADPPVLRPADPGAEAGRGLQVVQALATTWGWAMLGFHRKVVWAALRVPHGRPAPGGDPGLPA